MTDWNDNVCKEVLEAGAKAGNINICQSTLRKRSEWSAYILWRALYHSIKYQHFEISHVLMDSGSNWTAELLSNPVDEKSIDLFETGGNIIGVAIQSQNGDLFLKLMDLVPQWSVKSLFKILVRGIEAENCGVLHYILKLDVQWDRKSLWQLLFKCIAKERYDMCQELLDKITFSPDNFFYEALGHAASTGNMPMYKMIVSHMQVCSSRDQSLALANAVQCGHFDLMRFQLTSCDDWSSQTLLYALYESIKLNNVTIFQNLLSKAKDWNAEILVAKRFFDESIFTGALKGGNSEICSLLTDSLQISDWNDHTVKVALPAAVLYDNANICQRLLQFAPDISVDGLHNALCMSAEHGRTDICRMLLKAQRAPLSAEILYSSLEIAVEHGHSEVADVLIRAASDWTEITLSESLLWAAKANNVGVMQSILAAGTGWLGQSLSRPLLHLVREDNTPMVSHLLEIGTGWKALLLQQAVSAAIVLGNLHA